MVRRHAKDVGGEGHGGHRQPSRSGRKRRHEEDENNSNTPPSFPSHLGSQRTRERAELLIACKCDRLYSRGSSSSGNHRCGHCCHGEGHEGRADVGDDAKYRCRSEDNRDGAWQQQRDTRDNISDGADNAHRPCGALLNSSAPSPQAPMTAPLATSAADIPTASLACSVPPGATRADSRKHFPEALAESPQGPIPRVEAVDERKQLFRTRLYPTPLRVPASESAEWRCEALGASLTAPGVAFTDSVLGETFLNSLPSPCPLPRPPTPAFLPVAGALPPPSLSIAKTVPFSLEEHLTWLYAPASPTESRSSATVPPDMVAASCGLSRAERVRASRSERERKHESSRSTVSATVTQHSDLPIAPADVQEKAAPALMQDQGAASTATTLIPPNPLAPQHGEISYESSFSVVTSWDALMVAPPLLRTTPRMPSLLAHDVAGVGTTAARFGRLATSVHVCMSGDATRIPFNGSQGESLIGTSPAMETNETSQGGEARAGAEQQKPVFPSSHCAPSPAAVPPRVKCDGHEWSREDLLRQVEEDGVRTFVKHFTNGLVFVDPPWFICPVLLDNCEHPYYMTWLDELEVGSVEEAVAEAKAKLLTDA